MKPQSRIHSHRDVGQAMMEYMVLIPAAIMIGIAAAYAAAFINGAFQRTIDGLSGGLCEAETERPESLSGSTIAHLGDHTIELTSRVYNPDDNTTTVVYRVTSADKPSISHWNLELPREVYDNLISASEQREWMSSGDTSLQSSYPQFMWPGMKFDTGYEVGGGEDDGQPSDPDDGQPANPGGGPPPGVGGGPKSKAFVATPMDVMTVKVALSSDGTVSRDVILLFSGNYDWSDAYVVVKAGQEAHQDVISVPSAPAQVVDNQDC